MSLKNKSIAIIGLGWLGLPLAKLLKSKGHSVFGSTTTVAKAKTIQEKDFIETSLLDLNFLNQSDLSPFFCADYLIFNTPPNSKILDFFKIHTHKNQKIVFISSTSVYSPSQGHVDENSPPLPESTNGKLLLEIEEKLLHDFPNLSVIRPGGLIGDNRHPINHLKSIKDPENYVHLVFRDDLLLLIEKLINTNHFPAKINAVAQISMKKGEYYSLMAAKLHLDPIPVLATKNENPTFISDEYFKKIMQKSPISPLNYNR